MRKKRLIINEANYILATSILFIVLDNIDINMHIYNSSFTRKATAMEIHILLHI